VRGSRRRVAPPIGVLAGILLSLFGGTALASSPGDWTRFGFDASRSDAAPRGLKPSQVMRLVPKRVRLPGTVDSSPIYLSDVDVRGHRRDLLVVTTSYGITLGLNPRTGQRIWRFTPASYPALAGSYRITEASPAADPSDRFIYAASPDGMIHKLRVRDGREATNGSWPAPITLDPAQEKINSALNVAGKYVLATTSGYFDARPYQGAVVAVARATGEIGGVVNAMCSDREELLDPSSCLTGSSIWGRGGAVVDPYTGLVYATTGNGPFDGGTNWGDSILELAPGAAGLLRHYTPSNQSFLEANDLDLGSASPALLPPPRGGEPRYLLQGGKDRLLRLVNIRSALYGVTGSAGQQLGGESQSLPTPGHGAMVSSPAVLHRSRSTLAFVAAGGGAATYRLEGGRLHRTWHKSTGGTSPVVAGGLVWIYRPKGELNVYRAGNGDRVRRLQAPPGHWESPIVAGGRVYLTGGDANAHATQGNLYIYRVR
jgi:outer membrane protein assembly factor BamB